MLFPCFIFNKFIILLILFACNLLVSCKSEFTTKFEIKEYREYVYNTNFANRSKINGVYFSKIENQEYFFCGDKSTTKKISFFYINGIKKMDIPLNFVIDDGEDIDNVSVISFDSIAVLSLYTNKLYFLNRTGECWKKIELDSIIKPFNGDKFEYSSSPLCNFVSGNNNLILGSSWVGNKNEIKPEIYIDYLSYHHTKMLTKPLLISVKNIFDRNPIYQFGLDTFYSQISKIPSGFFEPNFYFFEKNKLFYFSWYSDKIFMLNPQSLKVEKEILIKSDYTQIGCTAIPINAQTADKLQDLGNHNLQNQGSINRFYYDKYRNLYYVIVGHTKKNDTRSSSLLIYDNNFNKLNEIFLEPDKYNSGNILICKDGLLISNNIKKKQNYEPKKAKYMLFKITQ